MPRGQRRSAEILRLAFMIASTSSSLVIVERPRDVQSAGDVAAKVLRRDMLLSSLSVRLTHIMSPMDHGKAERELGWPPEPVQEAIRRAAHWYRDYRRRSAVTTP